MPERADAVASRQRILDAAGEMGGDRRMTMTELAAAAGVGRSTLYRHFPTKEALVAALRRPEGLPNPVPEDTVEPTGDVAPLPFQPPGRLGRSDATVLDVTHVLDEVPPHLLADQLVAEARRAAGVAVALYVVDIDGSQLIRLAGSEDFPAELLAPPALGPEIVPEGLPGFYTALRERLPRCSAEPLWLRGRVIGLLLCIGQPVLSLADIAKQGAAALELANDYTDLIESARRRKPASPAAEVQQALLPPRLARVTGGQLAGGLLPSYEVGGDWFDYVENRDGVWVGVADGCGIGPTAAGLSASLLGALRSARRAGAGLVDAVRAMDGVVRGLPNQLPITVMLARWHAPTGTLTWVSCGHPSAWVADPDGDLRELDGPVYPALGEGDPVPEHVPGSVQLESGERVVLVTRGVMNRDVEGGGTFGAEGLARAVRETSMPTAAGTAMAIQHAVTSCWTEPLADDATFVVLAVD